MRLSQEKALKASALYSLGSLAVEEAGYYVMRTLMWPLGETHAENN